MDADVTLRNRLDEMIASFAKDVLRLIASASIEELGLRRPTPTQAPAPPKRAATKAPPKPLAKPAKPLAKPARPLAKPAKPLAKPAKVAAPPKRAIEPKAAKPAPPPQPSHRTGAALERALLAALRPSRPMGQDDWLDVAGIVAEEQAEARATIESLRTRGLIGESSFAGAALYFAKPAPRAAKGPRRAKGAPLLDASAPAATPTPATEAPAEASASQATTSAPEPAPWRPTVIRRKKPGAPESSQGEGSPQSDAAG
jgi:hypothetical protein